ncbi:MAG: EAL domain-containing protein [Pseudomonadota bacterium]
MRRSAAPSAAALLAALPQGVVLRDARGRVLQGNPAAGALLQLSPAQLLERAPPDPGWQALHGDGRPMAPHERPSLRALAEGRDLADALMGVATSGGRVRWLASNVAVLRDAQGTVQGTLASFADVTTQHRQLALLEHTIDAAGLGTWEWDMQAGTMACNDRLLAALGYRRGEVGLTEREWSRLVHPESRLQWQRAVRIHLDDASQACRVELRLRRPDGTWADVLSCGVLIERAPDGRPLRMAGIHIDMTEQVQMQAMLRHAARTDGLTQLPNRAAVFDQVQQAVERAAQQADFRYAVLFMDFDRFKQTNDTLGHAAGDELLRQIAQRLRTALRNGDGLALGALSADGDTATAGGVQQTAGRIGGDEFVVVLEGVQGREAACAVARRLLSVLAAPYTIDGNVVHSTASIGIVSSEQAANDAHTVMRDADTAMYEAKRAGRARYVVFHPAMHEKLARSVATEADLRLALQRDELFVVYQPVVDLQRGGPCGVEALVRWRHPQRGLVSPLEFIPVAEESGLVVALGALVLRTACQQLAQWQRTLGALAPASVAVNLSAVQLRLPRLAAEVQAVLAASGLAPQALQLEVTESLAAQDEAARERLREIKALGVRIALDDFGTGYSSLACLHQLPVDTVKIDRSFVSHAETSDYHRVLIEATIRVAQTLGMDTVAEGIETASQAALLRRLDCGRGQGYLWSAPLSAEALVAWLQQGGDGRAAA